MTGYPFDPPFSQPDAPRLELAMEVRLAFPGTYMIPDTPWGFSRGAVLVESGTFEGPKIRGRAIPNSGGDYACFRPDGTVCFDARYLLEEEDGTVILLRNTGFLFGRSPDTMDRIRAAMRGEGPQVPFEDYYLRSTPSFECPAGKHDWLTRHCFVGIGQRLPQGNLLRYYTVL